ncbi:MAG: hypothetical protein ACRC7V_03415, partial [Lachnospiraceae bacterium]
MRKNTKMTKNRRLKKSIRRTLGALFLISAIIVAAIPFPDSIAEDLEKSTKLRDAYEYNTSLKNEDISSGNINLGDNDATTKGALTIRLASSNT